MSAYFCIFGIILVRTNRRCYYVNVSFLLHNAVRGHMYMSGRKRKNKPFWLRQIIRRRGK